MDVDNSFNRILWIWRLFPSRFYHAYRGRTPLISCTFSQKALLVIVGLILASPPSFTYLWYIFAGIRSFRLQTQLSVTHMTCQKRIAESYQCSWFEWGCCSLYFGWILLLRCHARRWGDKQTQCRCHIWTKLAGWDERTIDEWKIINSCNFVLLKACWCGCCTL